jgi:hypothetical protein
MIPPRSVSPEVRLKAARPHPGQTRNRLRVFRRLALEDDKHGEVLVGGEPVVGTGFDEDGGSFTGTCSPSTSSTPVLRISRSFRALCPDAWRPAADHRGSMRRRSYAIWWKDGEGHRHAGKLEVAPLHVLLSGNGDGRVAVSFDEIVSIEYDRGVLRLDRRGGDPLQIGSLDAPGALLELVDALKRAA